MSIRTPLPSLAPSTTHKVNGSAVFAAFIGVVAAFGAWPSLAQDAPPAPSLIADEGQAPDAPRDEDGAAADDEVISAAEGAVGDVARSMMGEPTIHDPDVAPQDDAPVTTNADRPILPAVLGGVAVGGSTVLAVPVGTALAAMLFGVVVLGTTPGVGGLPLKWGDYFPVVAALLVPIPVISMLAAGAFSGAWASSLILEADESQADKAIDGALWGLLASGIGVAAGTVVGGVVGFGVGALGALSVVAFPNSVAQVNSNIIVDVALTLGTMAAVPAALASTLIGVTAGGVVFGHHLFEANAIDGAAVSGDAHDEGDDV